MLESEQKNAPLRAAACGCSAPRKAPWRKKITKHITIPTMVPVIFFMVASLPVELVGCRNRGLIAALVAIAAGLLGIVAAVKALLAKVRGEANSSLWMASALILAIPTIFIVLSAA